MRYSGIGDFLGLRGKPHGMLLVSMFAHDCALNFQELIEWPMGGERC